MTKLIHEFDSYEEAVEFRVACEYAVEYIKTVSEIIPVDISKIGKYRVITEIYEQNERR